ncbi:MAG: rhamnan synthesis F family protein [Pseudomonadota bacterium]
MTQGEAQQRDGHDGAAAVFVVPRDAAPSETGHFAKHLSGEVERLVLAVPSGIRAVDFVDDVPAEIVTFDGGYDGPFAGYAAGLRHLGEEWCGTVVLTGGHAFGPLRPGRGWLSDSLSGLNGVWSPYWTIPSPQNDATSPESPVPLPHYDMIAFGAQARRAADPIALWDRLANRGPGYHNHSREVTGYFDRLRNAGVKIDFELPPGRLRTSDPSLFEIHKIIAESRTVFPRAVLHIDPVLHDLNATYLRKALDLLGQINPELHRIVLHHAVTRLPARDFKSIADHYEVLTDLARNPDKSHWSFGAVAVLVDIFDAKALPALWNRISALPCQMHLFACIHRKEDRASVEALLEDAGWPAERTELHVAGPGASDGGVGSLFAAFRETALSGRFEVGLLLHCGQTIPRVPAHAARRHQEHLLDGVAASRGYVSNLLDILEGDPGIGRAAPPLTHVSVGLGYEWFDDKRLLQRLAVDMGLDVPIDQNMPVMPYGPMYWFRTKALLKLFERDWRAQAGGLSFEGPDALTAVHEQLASLCVQASGHRTVTAMTTRMATRGYAWLEYKHQLLTSVLVTNNIHLQRAELSDLTATWQSRLLRWTLKSYGAMLRRYPLTRAVLRPAAEVVLSFLNRRAKRQGNRV